MFKNMRSKKIINLTPHNINVGEVEIPKSGQVARISEKTESHGTVNGFPVVLKSYGEIENLPEPERDSIFLVSLPVLNALKSQGGRAAGQRRSDPHQRALFRERRPARRSRQHQ